jgi:hypothetical protein
VIARKKQANCGNFSRLEIPSPAKLALERRGAGRFELRDGKLLFRPVAGSTGDLSHIG